jgi:hypothetical protein
MKQILVQIKTDLGSILNWFWLNKKLILAQHETNMAQYETDICSTEPDFSSI